MTTETSNKVWIELVRSADKEFCDEQCRLANNMLNRLAKPSDLPRRDDFFYSEHDRCYCFGGAMGYNTLPDSGLWLSLDYLGRDDAN